MWGDVVFQCGDFMFHKSISLEKLPFISLSPWRNSFHKSISLEKLLSQVYLPGETPFTSLSPWRNSFHKSISLGKLPGDAHLIARPRFVDLKVQGLGDAQDGQLARAIWERRERGVCGGEMCECVCV